MTQQTHIPRKGGDADFAAVTVDSITVAGVSVVTALLLASGQVADLNGEADALVLDADADTTISAPTDDQIDIEINGADDFRFTANTFTALSGSTIATNTIAETTAASGVTIDGVLCKDNAVTASGGVTADLAGGVKETIVAVSADGAIAVPAASRSYFITKAGVAAMTIVNPTATTHDGIRLTFISTTAQAHTLDNSAGAGFNDGGAGADVGTFGGAKGDNIVIEAYQGKWYVVSKVNVTLG